MATGVQKVLEKTKSSIESGAFYEAQQMFKTVYHRYRARKQYNDGYQLLKEGAILQLQNGQLTCGVELAVMLIEAYVSDKVEPLPEALPAIQQIISAFPGPSQAVMDDSTALDELNRFVMKAIKWVHSRGDDTRELHSQFAAYIWQTYGWRRLDRASLHFSRGNDAQLYAEALNSCSSMQPDLSEEKDLFVARAVLQTLACAHQSQVDVQLQHAHEVLQCCQRVMHLKDSPLLHFIRFLTQALPLKDHDLFLLLKDKYQPSLQRDPSFSAYLTKIEELHFNVTKKGGMGGMFGGLLRSLLEVDEDE